MSLMTEVREWVGALVRGGRADREMSEELRLHLDLETRKHIASGLSPREARRRARLRFGNPDLVAEEVRDARGVRPIEDLGRDLRCAVRAIRKRPGYAAAFVVTLGLGIGANTAIFSLIDGVLLRPLPHQQSEQLIYLRHAAPLVGVENALFSVPEIEDLRTRSRSLGAVAELSTLTFTVLGLDEPRLVQAGIVTGNYFDVMGLRPSLGRAFSSVDDGETAPPVMLLSHDFWGRVFGFDPTVLGRAYQMNGRSVEIVGVLRPAPPYPERTDVFVNMAASPHHLEATMTQDRGHRMTEVFARLAPGATPEMARAEVAAVATTLRSEYPDAYDQHAGYEVSVTPLELQLTRRARPTLWILFATAALVLVIACANVANLTLTRVVARERELATRAALGASGLALRRALLIENLLLALAGTVVGVGVAWLGLDGLVAFIARFTSRTADIGLNGTVLGFAGAVATLAALAFALIPRLPQPGSARAAASGGGRTTGGAGRKRVQQGLVVAQVAVSVVLLAGAVLLGRTFLAVQSIDPGFDTENVLAMEVPTGLLTRSPDETRLYYETILRRVRTVAGVRDAAVGTSIPLSADQGGFSLVEVSFEGLVVPPGQPVPRVDFQPVSPDYFRTLGIGLLAGRLFDATDGPDRRQVVVVNRSLADRFFPDVDPIDRRLTWNDPLMRRFLGDEPRTIVGVVADARQYGLDRDVPPTVFQPFAQIPMASSLFVRTSGDVAAVSRPIREIIRTLNPSQPIENVASLEQVQAESLAPRRLNAALIGGFALLAMVIAAVGVFSVLAFLVAQRTREFGIRSALGAGRGTIAGSVLREGLLLAGAGLLVGVVGAAGFSRFLQGFLYGVSPLDPVTYLLVGVVFAVVAGLAAWLPARRAARVEPVVALRAD